MNTRSDQAPFALKQVFHPTDLSDKSRVAYAHALRITLFAGGDLTVFHVAKHTVDVEEADFPDAGTYLQAWGLLPEGAGREAIDELGIRIKNTTSQGSDPVDSALYYLERTPADLLVMATEARQGLTRVINRAVAEPIASEAEAAVLFLPESVSGFVDIETGDIDLSHILIPVAEQPDHRHTLEFVAGMLELLDVADNRITLLHVSSDEEPPAIEIPAEIEERCEMVVRDGSLVQVVNEFAAAESVNLTVLTSQGRRGLVKVLLGGNTEHVLRKSPCAVLAVPCTESRIEEPG
ncbi:MAG: universal stress protein [Pseudomonadota bacterium]|nr:universal stress protein [Pseudomonadota bacterium]